MQAKSYGMQVKSTRVVCGFRFDLGLAVVWPRRSAALPFLRGRDGLCPVWPRQSAALPVGMNQKAVTVKTKALQSRRKSNHALQKVQPCTLEFQLNANLKVHPMHFGKSIQCTSEFQLNANLKVQPCKLTGSARLSDRVRGLSVWRVRPTRKIWDKGGPPQRGSYQ